MFIKRGRKIIFIFLATIFALSFLLAGFAGKAFATSAADFSGVIASDWSKSSYGAVSGHKFSKASDGTLTDTFTAGGVNKKVTYPKSSGKAIHLWDFISNNSSGSYSDMTMVEIKQNYTAYLIPDLKTSYLITNDSTNMVVGGFETLLSTQIQCTDKDSGNKISPCPWDYYPDGTKYGTGFFSTLAYFSYTTDEGKTFKSAAVDYDLSYGLADSLHTEYMRSLNNLDNTSRIIRGATASGFCLDPGAIYTATQFVNCYFPNGGARFTEPDGSGIPIKSSSSGAPTITIPEHKGSFVRPDMVFTLSQTDVALGSGHIDRNYFYFVASKPDYPNLAIRIAVGSKCSSSDTIIGNLFVRKGASFTDDDQLKDNPDIVIDNTTFFTNLINKVYNKVSDTVSMTADNRTCPDVKFVNNSSGGQLDDWNVTNHVSNAGVGGSPAGKALYNNDTKMCTGEAYTEIGQLITAAFPRDIFCFADQGILNGIKWFSEMLATKFSDVLNIDSQSFSQNGVVQEVSNFLVTFINSLFLLVALVSILVTTLKIDLPALSLNSWQLKKMIPTIITTMILVNYSLSIANLIIEIMNFLVNYFMGLGNTDSATFQFADTVWSVKDSGWGVVAFRIIFLLGFYLIIAYLLLLLWLRKIVLVVLYMFAPVPYITNILPVEAIKKMTSQWWSNFINWAFMGPLAAILLGAASVALSASFSSIDFGSPVTGELGNIIPKSTNSLSLTSMVLVGVLLYLAATMPLKLGGALMASLQKATTAKVGKFAGNLAKGVAARAYTKTALPTATELKEAFAERGRKKMQAAQEKATRRREKLFGTSSISDVVESYAGSKGLNLPFRRARLAKASAELEKLNKEKDDKAAALKAAHESKDEGAIAKAQKEFDASVAAVSNQAGKVGKLSPSTYYSRLARLGKENEEMKKFADIKNFDELNLLFDKALAEKDHTKIAALYRHIAMNGDENDLYNAHGLDSDDIKGFSEMLMANGMGKKRAMAVTADVSKIAEKNNHWGVAKATYINNKGEIDYLEDDPGENGKKRRTEAIRFEAGKREPQDRARNFGRLAFVRETADGRTELHDAGKELILSLGPSQVEQMARAMPEQIEAISRGDVMNQAMAMKGVSTEFLQAVVAAKMGLNSKDPNISKIDLGRYAELAGGDGKGWESYKAEFIEKNPPKGEKSEKASASQTESATGQPAQAQQPAAAPVNPPPAAAAPATQPPTPAAQPGAAPAAEAPQTPPPAPGANPPSSANQPTYVYTEKEVRESTEIADRLVKERGAGGGGPDISGVEDALRGLSKEFAGVISALSANPNDPAAIANATKLLGPQQAGAQSVVPGGTMDNTDLLRKLTSIEKILGEQLGKK